MNFYEEFDELKLPLHGVRLPPFVVPNEDKEKFKLKLDCSNYDFLRALCLEAFRKKKFEKNSEQYKIYVDRTKMELEILEELGFTDYILMVWDVINFCKRKGIATGIGRGSAAGSLVLYWLGVTRIDPMKLGLYFERFISKMRAKKTIVDGVTYLDGSLVPDIDTDVSFSRRGEVLDYLYKKYNGSSCKIANLTTLKGKLLIKECGKIVAGKTETEVNEASALIPKTAGIVMEIDDAIEEVEDFKEWCEGNNEVYEIALKLKNLIKNTGVHASAVLVSFNQLDGNIPVQMTKEGELISSYEMKSASIENIKLDILGLRCVEIIDELCKKLNIDPESINIDDPFIYQQLQDLKTPKGLFQMEAEATYRASNKIKPLRFEHLAALMAITRPGASQFLDQFATFVNTGEAQSIHPFFDKILSRTGGLCLYQEQLMEMVRSIGFTMDESEQVRRVVGKKLIKEVVQWEVKIDDKIKENNLDPAIKNLLWKILEDSSKYSFNFSHAAAYAALAAITIYLKFKYPLEFYLTLLNMTRHESDPTSEIQTIAKELQYFNITLLPPHLMHSKLDFAIEGHNIRYGLIAIKGISDKSIENVVMFSGKHGNKFEIFEAARESKIKINIFCALIQCGALSGFKESRSMVVTEAQLWGILTAKERKLAFQYGPECEFNLINTVKLLTKTNNEKGKPHITENRLNTIRKDYEPYRQIFALNSQSEDFANWFYERRLLGYSYNRHLRDIFIEKCPGLISVKMANIAQKEESIELIGIVKEVYSGTSRNKNKYARFNIGDETGDCTVLIFKDALEACKQLNGNKLPEAESIVIVRGKKKQDAIFADVIAEQTGQRIYTKFSDIKQKYEEEEEKV
jgi:DNA polymerase-3 subunit alpha